jgi:hypothetical protein
VKIRLSPPLFYGIRANRRKRTASSSLQKAKSEAANEMAEDKIFTHGQLFIKSNAAFSVQQSKQKIQWKFLLDIEWFSHFVRPQKISRHDVKVHGNGSNLIECK